MQEAFLHYAWKFQKFEDAGLQLVSGQGISVIRPGHHNPLAGPDFLDARIRIDDTLWAGHVEIHVNASDWYAHKHQNDPAYNNVILHVVWHNDVPVLGKEEVPIPTIALRHYVPENLYVSYTELLKKRTVFIPCEKDIATVDPFIRHAWLERLYLERLKRRVFDIQDDLERSIGNWEAAFFIQLASGFGTKINKAAFTALARQIPFRVLSRSRSNARSLEALLMGMGGILEGEQGVDPYLLDLRQEFQYLKHKFKLSPLTLERVHYFKLRPTNFPTLRLSQLAGLLHRNADLLTKCMEKKSLAEFHQLLRVRASSYWDTHYTFGNHSTPKPKVTSRTFINTLVVNTILPFKYAYLRSRGSDPWSVVLQLIQQIKPESNSIIRGYQEIGIEANSAMDSQALLELYGNYCQSKRCLECVIGHQLLGRK